MLDSRIAADQAVTPVVVALKRMPPRATGALNHALAEKLTRWAEKHSDPHRHVHWLP